MPCELQKAVERGAIGIKEPWEESDDDGTVTFAVVKTVSIMCVCLLYENCVSLQL